MAELTKPIRDELRAALRRLHASPEARAAVKHLSDSASLKTALAQLEVADELLQLLENYPDTLTDGEMMEVLRSFE